jgi:peroxiredoxin
MRYFVFFLFISSVCFGQDNNDSISISHFRESDPLVKLLLGKKFHDFSAQDESGTKISSKDIKGKTALINFWFEACAPCVAEFESLNTLYNKYRSDKDFKFISFSFEDDSVIERVRKEYKLSYPIYHLSRDSCKLLTFDLQGYPSNYILDPRGRVAFVGIGGPIDKKRVELLFRYVYEAHIIELLSDKTK